MGEMAMYFVRRIRLIRCWLVLLTACLTSSSLVAAEPAIRNLDIHGLRVGGTTTLVLDGDDFGKTPRLLLPFTATQTLKPGATDKRAVFDITLADDVTPGYYQLRLVAETGVSLPVVIGADRLPQQVVTAPVTALPVALHGSVAGSTTVETKFQGKAKQKVMVEVEAQRLGSKLRPVVHLYTPKKLQLAWSWGTPALAGDARLEATLPEDGTYIVTVHDVEYAAAGGSFFRLRIGQWSFVDQVFPPVLGRDQAAALKLLGMAAPVRVDMAPSKSLGVVPLAWPRDGVWSGPRPFVTYSAFPEFVQQTGKDPIQELPPAPVAVSGRLLTPFGEDRYRVAVSPGTKLRLEVFAERIGSPLDAALVVRNDKGDQLARAEDSPGTLDPVLEFAVPEKVTSIIVGVVDAQGRGGPHGIYRLVVQPQTSAANKGTFKLLTSGQRVSLPVGGHLVIPVFVERQGYQGKIDLTASWPAGVKVTGAMIPEGADGTLVTLEGAAAFDALITHWHGRSVDGTEEVVVVKGHPLQRLQPWLATEIALAPSDAKPDLLVDWRNLPADGKLIPGSKLVLPIKAARSNEKTTVKLTLLTSQVTPLVNNQPDPNKALRQEKPVELPVKVADGEVTVLVPVELSAPVYAVTVQAELLAADKKVLATAYAPVRHLVVRLPLVVKLIGPDRIEAALDPKKGTTLKIQGRIERLEGMKGDVALALTGLPAGIKADAVTVKADATDFTLNVVLPPTVGPGEIKGLKLSGSFAPDAKQPNVRVRSREVDVTLVVLAPTKRNRRIQP
jgi:hypothetical protein